MKSAVAGVLAAVLLSGCSGDGGASEPVVSRTPSPSPSPSETGPPPLTPETRFALEVSELYALVESSVEGSGDYASSSQVLEAFATTVALVRVPPEQSPERQRVVDAAEAAADAYRTAAGITGALERAAAGAYALEQLQALELVIRTLPGAAPAVP